MKRQRIGDLAFRLTCVIAVSALVFLASSLPMRAQSESDGAATVTVLVYNFVGTPSAVLAAAERHAGKILQIAGARVDWVHCPNEDNVLYAEEPCRRGWALQTPGLCLVSGANKFQSAEFGYTTIPVYSTIYYRQIASRVHRDDADSDLPVLLGCVIAHELGHLLLHSARHSATGIMQPGWGSAQIHQALTGKLLFTGEEATRIQNQARILANLPRGRDGQVVPEPQEAVDGRM